MDERRRQQLSSSYTCPSYFKDSGKSNSKSADFFFRQTHHNKSQFGFRKNKSTIDAVATII
jgi:hypothetical protein